MFLYSQILQKQSKSFSVDVFVEEGHQVKHHHLNYFNISLESLLNYARVEALLRRFFIFNSHSTNCFSTEYGPIIFPGKRMHRSETYQAVLLHVRTDVVA